MKQFIKLITFCLTLWALGFQPVQAQKDIWDKALTELNIAHNIENYDDHQQFRDNQFLSQASVNVWMQTKNEFKKLSDKINQHLTQAFIVEADILTLYNIEQAFRKMYDYQSQSINIAVNVPYADPVLIQKEQKIINEAYNLLTLVELIVQTYGEINKMKTSDRQIIYREINTQLQRLTGQCFGLLNTMKLLQTGNLFKNSKPVQYVNKDKQIANDIVKQLKF
jgi:hypothetical protein